MEKRGDALIGIGIGVGENRATEAAEHAVASPLLERSIEGATDAIINVTGGPSLALFEVEEAAEVIRKASNTDINTIFGAIISENLTDEIIVTVIATGFEDKDKVDTLYSPYARRETTVQPADDSDSDDGVGSDIPFFKRRG